MDYICLLSSGENTELLHSCIHFDPYEDHIQMDFICLLSSGGKNTEFYCSYFVIETRANGETGRSYYTVPLLDPALMVPLPSIAFT